MMKRVAYAIIPLVFTDQRVRKELIGLRLTAVAFLFMHGDVKVPELDFHIFAQRLQDLINVAENVDVRIAAGRQNRR